MQIDWTQTLLGSDGTKGRMPEADGAMSTELAVSAARHGRIAGVLSAVILFGGAIATLPLRGVHASLPDILVLCGLLVANVVGFALLHRLEARGLMAAAALTLLMPLFAAGAGLPSLLVLALASISACEMLWVLRAKSGRSLKGALLAASLATGAALGGLAAAYPEFRGLGALCGALAPLLVIAATMLARRRKAVVAKPQMDLRANALLDIAMRRLEGVQVMTDLVGTIDMPNGVEASGLGHSLVDAILIADRPPVLHALSRAIHAGQATEELSIRLRKENPAAGFAAPPRYVPHLCAIYPATGCEGRAIIVLQSDENAAPRASGGKPITPQGADQALLSRALHDSVSPFNAGLGFLEMIGDARLAPRDLATFRSYASEAHKALSEGHRNAALLGRWLKLAQPGFVPDEIEIAPADLFTDAVRALNLAGREEFATPSLELASGNAPIRVSGDAARFAMLAFVRAIVPQVSPVETLRIRIERNGDDLCFSAFCAREKQRRPFERDVFQQALEQAAMQFCAVEFSASALADAGLTFRGIFAAEARKPETAKLRLVEMKNRLAS